MLITWSGFSGGSHTLTGHISTAETVIRRTRPERFPERLAVQQCHITRVTAGSRTRSSEYRRRLDGLKHDQHEPTQLLMRQRGNPAMTDMTPEQAGWFADSFARLVGQVEQAIIVGRTHLMACGLLFLAATVGGAACSSSKSSSPSNQHAGTQSSVVVRATTSMPPNPSSTSKSPPGVPSAGGAASGNNITWSWSGGDGSGLPIASYMLCVDGGCSNVGAGASSTTRGYGCGQTHSAYAYVVDSVGQRSGNSNTASATTAACPPPPPAQSVIVSWGGKAPAGTPSLTRVVVVTRVARISSFRGRASAAEPTNSLAYFDGGNWGAGPFTVSGSSGSYNGHMWAGYCHQSHSVGATVDSTRSNTINTNQHSC